MGAVRGWTKAIVWVGILLGCAAVGAFIASRSNPFPPGVPDPGAVPSETPTPRPPAGGHRVDARDDEPIHPHVPGRRLVHERLADGARPDPRQRIRPRPGSRRRPPAPRSALRLPVGPGPGSAGRDRDPRPPRGGRLRCRFRVEDVLPQARRTSAPSWRRSSGCGSRSGSVQARASGARADRAADGDVFASFARLRLGARRRTRSSPGAGRPVPRSTGPGAVPGGDRARRRARRRDRGTDTGADGGARRHRPGPRTRRLAARSPIAPRTDGGRAPEGLARVVGARPVGPDHAVESFPEVVHPVERVPLRQLEDHAAAGDVGEPRTNGSRSATL